MATTNRYHLRAPARDDLSAVTALLIACDISIAGKSDVTEEETAHHWNLPGFVLETDAVVAADPEGVVVGYEEAQSPGERLYRIDGYIHPDRRGHGIDAMLLEWAQRRACEMHAQDSVRPGRSRPGASIKLRANIYASELDAAALFRDHCFVHVRRSHRMQIELDQPIPAPVWPEGIEVRPFRLNRDVRVAYEIMRETFQDVWGHVSAPYDEWVAKKIGRIGTQPDEPFIPAHGFDSDLWFIVWQGDTPVAAALGRRRAEGGWIRGLGVRKPWRGQGIALAMLYHAFSVFRDHGFPFVGLGVDSQSLTGADRLYMRAGMHVVAEYDMFEKAIDPAAADGAPV